MKKKFYKFICIILLLFSFSIMLNKNMVHASLDPDTIIQKGKDFVSTSAEIDTSEVTNSLVGIGKVLVMIAVGVVLSVGMILGVKYIMSEGDGKAKIKERLIYYFIGISVTFGAVGITNLFITVLSSFN